MQSIGADIEVLLRDKDHNLVSGIGLIGGDKAYPFQVELGNLQEDNVLAEYAIDPVTTREAFIQSVLSVKNQLEAKVAPLELSIDISSSAIYPPCQLDHPAAREFGCDPDYDAWTGRRNRRPRPREVGRLRTCGGHIHVGFDYEGDGDEIKRKVIQWMDALLGLPSVMVDTDRRRRSVYGRSGAYRDKDYGVEYRVLSNFWIKSPQLIGTVYDKTKEAFSRATSVGISEILSEQDIEQMREAINSGDESQAVKYMELLEVSHF